ncbi:helix-hairpin-helix domain-containing protein [Bacillus sp. B190/17]|uniref:Helix-hairpin-helix domain-containing protein n=1 Tax=Bacillus lumedeiriae TaxID=3058829 RepID=A0ABW8I4L6_9BACI
MDIKAFIEKYKIYFLIGTALAAIGLYQLTEEEEPLSKEPFVMEESIPAEKKPASPLQEKPQEPAGLMVDIKGAVAVPGIYSLKNGDRINDAVAKAGGFQKDADRTVINLAQKLQDEMVIYVPLIGEEPPDNISAGMPGESVGGSLGEGGGSSGGININTAAARELQELPGIGEAKAQAIIDYRETTGPFSKPEDLKNVSGIGEKTFEKLEPLIVVH